MGQLVVSVAGAAVGGFLGGVTGAQIGWAIGSAIGGALFPPEPKKSRQSLIDLKVVGTDYGQPIPYARGTVLVAGQVWWNSDRQPHEDTTTTGGGKGGGGQKVETTTITYTIDLLIGLTDVPIVGIKRIWDNGKLIWIADSSAPDASLLASEEAENWERMTVYTGASDQLPDPDYELAVGGRVPAYRDRGSVFLKGVRLGSSGSMRNFTFEVVVDGILSSQLWRYVDSDTADDGLKAIYYSEDLDTWVAMESGSQFVIATAWYSTDNGETWTSTPAVAGGANDWSGSTYGGGYFVFTSFYGADTNVMYSADGINWALTPGGAGENAVRDVAYGNGVWVVVNDNGPDTSCVSSDITAGFTVYHDVGNNARWKSVCFGDGKFVAVGPNDNGGFQAATSLDGQSWLPQATPEGAWESVAFYNGLFVAVASTAADLQKRFMTSPDGETWTAQTSPNIGATSWNSVVGGGGLYMACSGANISSLANKFAYSTDGITWTLDDASGLIGFGDNAPGPALAYGNGRFIAASNENQHGTSKKFAIRDTRLFISSTYPTLREVVEDLCDRAGLGVSQIDASPLDSITRPVKSLAVSQITSTRQVLDLLATAFFFEMTVDSKLKFIPRGGSSVVTLTYNDLGASFDPNSDQPVLSLKELNDLEIPAQLALTYINIDNDYQPDTQYSDRLISATGASVEDIQLALGMQPTEAKEVVDVMLADQAASRISGTITILGDKSKYQPTDPITITMADGSTLRMRSTRLRDSYPVMEHQLILDEASVLESQGITSADYTSSTAVSGPINTTLRLLDTPLLRDVDNDAGFYAAAKPATGTTFPGAAVFDSDDDTNFVRKATILESAVIGTTTTALGDWTGSRIVDEVNSVTVNVGEGTLESSTRTIVLENSLINAILIGDEVLQFITATLVSAGIYTLTRLLRGGRGTEWAMVGHTSSERVVLLREAGLRRIPLTNSQLGFDRYYRAVTLGRSVSSTTSQLFTNTGVGLKPFSPSDLRGSRDTSGNLTVTWQRRSRFTTRFIGSMGISVPLGESEESYDVEFLNYDTTMTVQKSETVTDATTATFSAAEQLAAGITPFDLIYVKVYQLSSVVGRGYALEGFV